MPLDKQVVPITFSRALDTKADPLTMIAGTMIALEDVVFITPTSYRKRNGYVPLSQNVLNTGTITSGSSLKTFSNSLVLLDANNVYSYSEATSNWDPKGFKEVVSLSVIPVTGRPGAIGLNTLSVSSQNTAIASNGYQIVTCVLDENTKDNSGFENYNATYSVIDTATGQPVISNGNFGIGMAILKPFSASSSFRVVGQNNNGGFFNIWYYDVTYANPGTATSGGSIVSTSTTQFVPFDLVTHGTNSYIFYLNTSNLPALSILNSSMAVTGTVSLSGEAATVLTLAYDTTNNYIWLLYQNGGEVRYAIYDTSLNQILAPTNVQFITARNLSLIVTSGVATIVAEVSGSSASFNLVYIGTASTVSTAGLSVTKRQFGLASKIFLSPSNIPQVFITHQSTLQNGYFLLDLKDATSGGINNNYASAKVAQSLGAGITLLSTLPEVPSLSANVFSFPYFEQIDTTINAGVVTSSFALNLANLNYSTKTSTLEIANNLSLSGGILSVYDGAHTVESGFHIYPENITTTPNLVGGGMALGQYQYSSVYEWPDNYGQIQRSAPSPASTVTLSSLVLNGQTTSSGNVVQNLSSTDSLFIGMGVSSAHSSAGAYITSIAAPSAVGVSVNGTAISTEDVTFTPQLLLTILNSTTTTTVQAYPPDTKYVIGSTVSGSARVFVNDFRGLSGGKTCVISTDNGYIPANTKASDNFSGDNRLFLTANATSTKNNIVIKLTNSFSGNFTSGNPTITAAGTTSTLNLYVGQFLYGSAIPVGTTITALGATSITMSANATSTGTIAFTGNWPLSTIFTPGQTITSTALSGGTHFVSFNDTTSVITLDSPVISTVFSSTTAFVTNVGNVTTTVPNLPLTQKIFNNTEQVNIVNYRTQSNQELFYKIGSFLNKSSVDTSNIYDSFNDSQIIGNEQIYTTGDELENIAPPASDIITTFDNRVFLIPSENLYTYQFSKQAILGVPMEFSDLLTSDIDQTGGVTTAMKKMDDKLIFFKKRNIFYIVGTGPSRSGSNSQFSKTIKIETDNVGCINPYSIVETGNGLMFQSENGIQLLDRKLNVSYIGSPVEAYNSATVTSAALIPGTTQVRFTLNNGIALMYDTSVGLWGTFKNISAVDSVIYNGKLNYLQSNGLVLQESPGIYTDNGTAISRKFQTGWISVAGFQGFQRIYEMMIAGTYESPHSMIIQVAYDFNPTPVQTDTIVVSGPIVPLQYRIQFKNQTCEAVQITLYDTDTVPLGAGADLSGMSFLVGIKKGLRKIAAAVTYG